MAKSLSEIVADIRVLIGKKKLKAARKTIDKTTKQGLKGPLLKEVVAELLVAEGGGPEAAKAMLEVGRVSKTRVPALVKIAETHLRRTPDDHAVRDVVWEMALAAGKFDVAVRHLGELVGKNGIDASRRAKELVGRKADARYRRNQPVKVSTDRKYQS